MAEGTLDLPIGAPLGGYTGRCRCFGDAGDVDNRDSAYVQSFNSSAGIQTRTRGQALWLENGDQDLVIIRADLIYAFEGVVEALEDELGEATGTDLDGKVVLAVSHTHNAPANWDHGIGWYLGGDRFNREIFERLVSSLKGIALEAHARREPAAIGIGMAVDWDPDDRVYRDRRGENDELEFFEGIAPGKHKDPTLTVLRIDTAGGEPMGMLFAFGVHGTTLGAENAMVSTDATGHVETALQERFDTPVVVGHLQAGGGDASPVGLDEGYARLESIGELAADAIHELWSLTPTSTEPISLETVTHGIDTARDNIRVTRDGTVDWRYAAYDPDREPDNIIYGDDGEILSPIDEFNTQYGGAFCGADLPLIPGASIGSTVPPYSSCIEVETISWVIRGFFGLEEEDVSLPLPESLRASATAARIGPLPIREADGTEVIDDALFAFFPGETTSMYTEQFRRRAAAETRFSHAFPIGYAQDHEGYLMIPEDWLLGGYEPNINVWGPLQGEHIMEGMLEIADTWLGSDVLEPQDPDGSRQPTRYADEPMHNREPDITAEAGLVLSGVPDYLYQPLAGLDLQVQPDVELHRVAGIAQLIWEGGDPGVDLPTVTLEREQEDGTWNAVLTEAGRPITDSLPDILLAHTPDPLYPYEDAQHHTWWAAWQAVGHVHGRAAVPTGRYRLHVLGQHYTGGGEGWPWPTEAYELTSEVFELLPGELSLSEEDGSLWASLTAPAAGYRLVFPP